MEKNKLILLFKTFTKEEFKELDRFVHSPLYNKHAGVTQLFTCLRKQIEGGKASLSPEKLLKKIFPKGEGKAQDLYYLNSYLLKVVEQYLAWAEWQKEEQEWGIYLLRAYQKKGLEKPFQQKFKKTVTRHRDQPLRNATFYRQKYLLQWEEHSYSMVHGRQKGFNLQNLSNTHEQSFIAEKLKTACILLSHQAIAKQEYDNGMLEEVLKYVEQKNFAEIPAIALNYHSYMALTNTEDDEHFRSLKNQLLKNNDCFTLEELRDGHIVGINCCIRRINIGKEGFFREIMDMYKLGLELKVFLVNDQMSPPTFINIILSALKLKDFDWVYQFINEYHIYLLESYRESYFNYSLACYYYELGDYRQAMPLFLKIDDVDLIHNLSAKTMLAKMYYELQELDALEHLLSSFKAYIYRKKVLGYHRDNYLSMIKLMHKLMALQPYAKAEKQKFKEEIENTKMSPKEKEWLLTQVRQR